MSLTYKAWILGRAPVYAVMTWGACSAHYFRLPTARATSYGPTETISFPGLLLPSLNNELSHSFSKHYLYRFKEEWKQTQGVPLVWLSIDCCYCKTQLENLCKTQLGVIESRHSLLQHWVHKQIVSQGEHTHYLPIMAAATYLGYSCIFTALPRKYVHIHEI